MPKINQRVLDEIEVELSKWAEFLNIGVGLLSFSLGISCLGTDHIGTTALISLLFMLLFMGYGQRQFPKKIVNLRKAELTGVDELILIGLEKKHFGFKGFLKNFPVFTAGWTFLGGVALYDFFR